MKTVYKFKPHQHWNYITEDVYKVLHKFYAEDRLIVMQEGE